MDKHSNILWELCFKLYVHCFFLSIPTSILSLNRSTHPSTHPWMHPTCNIHVYIHPSISLFNHQPPFNPSTFPSICQSHFTSPSIHPYIHSLICHSYFYPSTLPYVPTVLHLLISIHNVGSLPNNGPFHRLRNKYMFLTCVSVVKKNSSDPFTLWWNCHWLFDQ